jgi:hypothetical protein
MPNKPDNNIQRILLEPKSVIELDFLTYRIRHLHIHEQNKVVALIDSFFAEKNIGKNTNNKPKDLNDLSYEQLIEIQNMVQSFDHGNPTEEEDDDDIIE